MTSLTPETFIILMVFFNLIRYMSSWQIITCVMYTGKILGALRKKDEFCDMENMFSEVFFSLERLVRAHTKDLLKLNREQLL
jgi:hypothetical protein